MIQEQLDKLVVQAQVSCECLHPESLGLQTPSCFSVLIKYAKHAKQLLLTNRLVMSKQVSLTGSIEYKRNTWLEHNMQRYSMLNHAYMQFSSHSCWKCAATQVVQWACEFIPHRWTHYPLNCRIPWHFNPAECELHLTHAPWCTGHFKGGGNCGCLIKTTYSSGQLFKIYTASQTITCGQLYEIPISA